MIWLLWQAQINLFSWFVHVRCVYKILSNAAWAVLVPERHLDCCGMQPVSIGTGWSGAAMDSKQCTCGLGIVRMSFLLA